MKYIKLGWLVAAALLMVLNTAVMAEEQPPLLLVPAAEQAVDEGESVSDNESTTAGTAINGEFIVYILRHAEKEEDHVDPGLTSDGYRRADGIAQLLYKAGIERIYSTFYRRNVGTALPLARATATPIEFYQSGEGDDLVSNVISSGQTTLIVGHSNTVANLVQAFGGEASELDEETYGDLYQLFLRVEDGHVVSLHQVHLTAPLLMRDRRQR